MKKRVLAIILCMTMLMSSTMCMTVYAKETEDVSLSDLGQIVSDADIEATQSSADVEQADDSAVALQQEEKKEGISVLSDPTEESAADIESIEVEKDVESETDIPSPQVHEFAPSACGYIPDYRILSSTQTDDGRIKGTLPSSYSSVDGGVVTPVKDQNPYGCCWAFSSVNCIESSLLSKGIKTTPDFSELHLAYFTFNRPIDPLGLTAGDSFTVSEGNGLDVGGNYRMATYTLASGVGPVPDKVLPYDLADGSASYDSSLAYKKRSATIKNVIEISAGNSDGIKDAVMKYGSVGTSYYHDNNYISANGAYYNYEFDVPNHAVSIVGWDDNYPKENFNSVNLPQSNGAWLIKNSWGDWFADDGYCWISYEDLSFMPDISGKYESCFAFDFTDGADEDEYNYQYDGGYINSSISSSDNTGGFANIYTAKRGELIKSVGVVTENENLSYSLQIYKNPTSDSDPTSGTAMLSSPAEGKFFEAGYHTITLSSQPRLKAGDKFAAVITLTCESDKNIDMIYDTSANWGWCESVSAHNSGESYILYSSNWYDLHNFGGAARVKVHTVPAPKETYTISFDSNGGSNRYDPKTKHEGTDINLYSKIPDRDGYSFLNWNTEKDGTGDSYEPGGVYSVDADVTFYAQWQPDGTCGENMTWTLDEEGSLVLSGKGGMYLWTKASEYPWYSESAKIKSVTVANIITGIGEAAFAECSDITMYGYSGTYAEIYATKNNIQFVDLTPSLKASPAVTSEVGKSVTLTASGGSTYKFYYECAGAWVRIQNFSTVNTCTWTPAKSGNYNLYCDIKDASGNVTAKKIAYKVTGTEPLKVSLSFQYASPQKAGTTIKITANATGGKGALKYKFYSECNGVWTKLWDYDTRVSYNWHATTVGTHTLYCDVMDETGEVVCAVVKYNIVKGEDFVADLNANRISGQLVGTEIRLLGGSSNGIGTVKYKFYYEIDGNWVKLQDFSTQDYCLWTPTKAGYYNVYLDAKDSAGHTASKRLCITIDEGQTLKVTNVTANPTQGTVETNTTFTAVSTGGSGTVTYKFYYEMGGSWVKLQDFSEKKTCTWKPTKAGTYHIYVDAIDGTKNTQCLMINYVVK